MVIWVQVGTREAGLRSKWWVALLGALACPVVIGEGGMTWRQVSGRQEGDIFPEFGESRTSFVNVISRDGVSVGVRGASMVAVKGGGEITRQPLRDVTGVHFTDISLQEKRMDCLIARRDRRTMNGGMTGRAFACRRAWAGVLWRIRFDLPVLRKEARWGNHRSCHNEV